jgi:hypothetical protein
MIESQSRATTLLEAAAAAGGVQALARRLRVPTKQLGSWMQGDAEAPASVIMRAVYFLQCALQTPVKRSR